MCFGRHAEVFSHLKIIVVIKKSELYNLHHDFNEVRPQMQKQRCACYLLQHGYTTQVQNI
jgi:hypothetical protein